MTNNSKTTQKSELPARSAVPSQMSTPDSRSSRGKGVDYGNDSLTEGKTRHGRSERVGARQLDMIRLGLSERDLRILRSLTQHRFLTTEDLQRWHFAAHASAVTAARTCRRVLARLARDGVVQHLERRIGGFTAGSARSVWHLTPVGERLVRGSAARRVREPSPAFLAHELGVAQMHLALQDEERAGSLTLLDFTTEPTCWRRFTGIGGSLVTLKPDFFAAVRAHADYESLYFGEYDRGTESTQTIVKKAAVFYEAYWRSGQEEERSGAFPKVAWIVPDEERKQKLRRALGRSALVTTELHHVITEAEFIPSVLADATEEGGEA